MYQRKKGISKKVYLAIILLAVLIPTTAVLAYTQMTPKTVKVGVQVGDTFTYSLSGTSTLTGLDAVDTPNFGQYNATDYYKITITGIDKTNVTMDTVWKFLNGTEIDTPQRLDIANGNKSDTNGFWALYPAASK